MSRTIAVAMLFCVGAAAHAQNGSNELGSLDGRNFGSGPRSAAEGLSGWTTLESGSRTGKGAAVEAKAEELGIDTQPAGQGAPAGQSFDAHYWFLHAGVGPTVAMDSRVRIDRSLPSNRIEFYPGFRADVAVGYQFVPWFALEGQIAFTSNTIRSIEGSANTEGDFEQIAHMVNAVFKLPSKSGVEPYLGVGAGLSLEVLNIESGTVQGTPLHGYDGALSLAAQFIAGVRFRLGDRWGLQIEYEYLAMSRPEFDLVEFTPARSSGLLEVKNPRTHSLTAAFVFKF